MEEERPVMEEERAKSARLAAYGAGFFFFWLFTFAGAALTAYMLDSSRNGLKRSEGERP